MNALTNPSIINLAGPVVAAAPLDGINWTDVSTASAAIQMMRMMRFDLMVLPARLPEMPACEFMATVREAWPWQKWVIVGGMLDEREEIAARTLGVTRIFDLHPPAEELIELLLSDRSSVRRKLRPTVVVPGIIRKAANRRPASQPSPIEETDAYLSQ